MKNTGWFIYVCVPFTGHHNEKSDHVVEPTRNQQFGVLIMAPKDNQPM
jgi:hypothetical protein